MTIFLLSGENSKKKYLASTDRSTDNMRKNWEKSIVNTESMSLLCFIPTEIWDGMRLVYSFFWSFFFWNWKPRSILVTHVAQSGIRAKFFQAANRRVENEQKNQTNIFGQTFSMTYSNSRMDFSTRAQFLKKIYLNFSHRCNSLTHNIYLIFV